MPSDLDTLRSTLVGKLEPPVDVLIDPSLLVAETTRDRLADSPLFDAQSQATLGGQPTRPPIGTIAVPEAFHQLVFSDDGTDVPRTATWNFYRGQAEGATHSDVTAQLESHAIESYGERLDGSLDWKTALDEGDRSSRLVTALGETRAALAGGFVLLARTSASLAALRDAGTVTIDIGHAELTAETEDRLTEIGYRNPALTCGFGVDSAPGVTSALREGLLDSDNPLVVYRLGR